MPSAVTFHAFAPASVALEHFGRKFQFETDCWDVHEAMEQGNQDFVLLDVRSAELFEKSHVPGALSLPHRKIVEGVISRWPVDTKFVVYCAGPHCNGADRAALRLASLGRDVKVMIGGLTGWHDEGFRVQVANSLARDGKDG